MWELLQTSGGCTAVLKVLNCGEAGLGGLARLEVSGIAGTVDRAAALRQERSLLLYASPGTFLALQRRLDWTTPHHNPQCWVFWVFLPCNFSSRGKGWVLGLGLGCVVTWDPCVHTGPLRNTKRSSGQKLITFDSNIRFIVNSSILS